MASTAPSPPLRRILEQRFSQFAGDLAETLSAEMAAAIGAAAEEAKQAAARDTAEHLNHALRRLGAASNFTDVSAILADAGSRFAAICAVFRVEGESLRGERMRDPAGVRGDFDTVSFTPGEAAAFGAVLESRDAVTAAAVATEISGRAAAYFGVPASERVFLTPIVVNDAAAGVLCGSGSVQAGALELLAQAAGMALAAVEARKPAPPEPAPVAAGLIAIQSAPAAKLRPDWDELTPAEQKLHLEAQRFARVRVSQIRLERGDAVRACRTRGNLYPALRAVLDPAREEFRRRFLSASQTMLDYLHTEAVRTLAGGDATLFGNEYPGAMV